MKFILLAVVLFQSYIGLSQLAGTISPTAKTIDADLIFPFRSGSALITKGTAYGLINDKAAFVVPFNTYTRIEYENTDGDRETPSFTGIYETYNSRLGEYGFSFINSAGKTLYKQSLKTGLTDAYFGKGTNDYGSVRVLLQGSRENDKEVHFSSTGDVIQFPDGANAKWNEGIATYRDDKVKDNKGFSKMGFKNSKGQIIISPQFDYASVFSEGLAAVAKKNEFGELKWGYTDVKGNMVIPFKYSNKPSDFGNGLASVVPVVVEDFKVAFINKRGDIVLKIPTNSPLKAISKFINGYAFSGTGSLGNYDNVLDTTGKVFKATELFKLFGLPTTYLIQTEPFYNQQMFFATGYDKKKGILDFSTRKYIPAIFEKLSFFDPVSGLAYAKLFLRDDEKNSKKIYREGYINKDGVFVLIKGEPSKF